jgi:hypothetical protein
MVSFARKDMQPHLIYFGETRGVALHPGTADGIAAGQ